MIFFLKIKKENKLYHIVEESIDKKNGAAEQICDKFKFSS